MIAASAVATPARAQERVGNPSHATALAAGIAALIALAVGIAVIDQYPVGVVHDDGMYMILAKSLATGHGYRYINLPGEPHATHFPPGYPLLLSLLWRIGPEFPANVVFFKMFNALCLGAAAAGLTVFARRRLDLSAPAACLTAIAGCASIPILVLSNLVMSETLFLALLVPLLLYAESCLGADDTSPRQAVALAVLGGLLMLVRSHAIALVGAIGLVLLLRRRFRALAIYAVVAVLVALPWHFWQSVYAGSVPAPMRGDYESYGGWFLNGSPAHSVLFILRTIAKQAQVIYAMLLVFATSGIPTRALRHFGTIVTIALMVAGLFSMRRRAPVTALFICGFLGIIFVWPFTPARFVWAVWPLLVVLFAAGVAYVASVILRPSRAVHGPRDPVLSVRSVSGLVAAAGIVVTLIGYSVYNTRGYTGHWWSSIAREQSAIVGPMVVWVARNTAPTDVISSNSEVMVYLYTGRPTVPATQFLADDYFDPPTPASREAALRSILQSYRVGVVAVAMNESLNVAARNMTAGQDPMLVLRDSIQAGLIFTPRTPTGGAQRRREEQ